MGRIRTELYLIALSGVLYMHVALGAGVGFLPQEAMFRLIYSNSQSLFQGDEALFDQQWNRDMYSMLEFPTLWVLTTLMQPAWMLLNSLECILPSACAFNRDNSSEETRAMISVS